MGVSTFRHAAVLSPSTPPPPNPSARPPTHFALAPSLLSPRDVPKGIFLSASRAAVMAPPPAPVAALARVAPLPLSCFLALSPAPLTGTTFPAGLRSSAGAPHVKARIPPNRITNARVRKKSDRKVASATSFLTSSSEHDDMVGCYPTRSYLHPTLQPTTTQPRGSCPRQGIRCGLVAAGCISIINLPRRGSAARLAR